jgi:hypothetical protein
MSGYRNVREVAKEGLREAQLFLHAPEVRKVRTVVAAGLIVAAPIIARHPYVRGSKVLRLVGVAGGAAIIVKVAETIRDWEPQMVADDR